MDRYFWQGVLFGLSAFACGGLIALLLIIISRI